MASAPLKIHFPPISKGLSSAYNLYILKNKVLYIVMIFSQLYNGVTARSDAQAFGVIGAGREDFARISHEEPPFSPTFR
jgi:hypothetical protein